MRCRWCFKHFEKTLKNRKYCSSFCRKSYYGKYKRNKRKIKYIRTKYWSRTQKKTVTFRSSYELTYAQYLDRRRIKWCYEYKKFVLSNGRIYIPDFYLPDSNEWKEVKGKWFKKSKVKFELFKQDYPNENIEVIDSQRIFDIRKQLVK